MKIPRPFLGGMNICCCCRYMAGRSHVTAGARPDLGGEGSGERSLSLPPKPPSETCIFRARDPEGKAFTSLNTMGSCPFPALPAPSLPPLAYKVSFLRPSFPNTRRPKSCIFKEEPQWSHLQSYYPSTVSQTDPQHQSPREEPLAMAHPSWLMGTWWSVTSH